jgi:hypothetical protein
LHLVQNVDGLPITPAVNNNGDLLGHNLGIGWEAGIVEGGLSQPALPPMPLVRAGGETATKALPDPVEDDAAFVESAVVDENLLGQRRIANHDRPEGSNSDLHQVSIRRQRNEVAQRIMQKRKGVAKER